MIKPTIGRVVWFWPDNVACYDAAAQPNPALVTFVHDDKIVNLVVFDKNGDGKACPVIRLWDGDSDGPRPASPHCEWMPYQKEQAAKHQGKEGLGLQLLAKRIDDLEAKLLALANTAAAAAGIQVNVPSAQPKDLITGSPAIAPTSK